ncbi:interleukin-15 isoform X2 [Sphaerodactylus townsendi]|uniref:interleukin-15 isoform X2 n=1 Tax=Sphaerodactylus townsendi TaxID=933632 RepID=UPI00202611A1|nr:interleukin-15 isoform X2 [Sphaerodactylus townsendi]XP_048365696.1 interleukin-15 isoform X2 [Sphaerodactylus townsendi]
MNTYLLPASLNNKLTVTIFIFCSYLLQVQTIHFATLRAVLADLEKIKPCSKIDATLYTAEMTDRNECKESVMKCFILEMEVIFHESNYGHSSATFTNNVHNVLKNFSHFRNSSYSNPETSTCRKCETFEEKTCTEFLKSFEIIVNQLYRELPANK